MYKENDMFRFQIDEIWFDIDSYTYTIAKHMVTPGVSTKKCLDAHYLK